MQDDKTRQQKYRVMLKEQGLKLLNIPLPERDIEIAMQLTNAPKERAAILAIFNIGLGRQRDLLNDFETDKKFDYTERDKLLQENVTANELIATLTTERDKLIATAEHEKLLQTLMTDLDLIAQIDEKIHQLPAEVLAEVDDYVSFLLLKYRDVPMRS